MHHEMQTLTTPIKTFSPWPEEINCHDSKTPQTPFNPGFLGCCMAKYSYCNTLQSTALLLGRFPQHYAILSKINSVATLFQKYIYDGRKGKYSTLGQEKIALARLILVERGTLAQPTYQMCLFVAPIQF